MAQTLHQQLEMVIDERDFVGHCVKAIEIAGEDQRAQIGVDRRFA